MMSRRCFSVVPILAAAVVLGAVEAVGLERGGVRMLMLVPRYYGLNTFLLWDALDRLGWEVTLAGVQDTVTACPPVARSGIPPVIPEILARDIPNMEPYDGIILPPASGSFTPVPDPYGDIRSSREAMTLLRDAARQEKIVYATCAGVPVLVETGVLSGRGVVGSDKFQKEIEAGGSTFLGKDHAPSIDQNIVTSARGLYYNVCNAMAIATALENTQGRKGPKRHGKTVLSQERIQLLEVESLLWAWTYGSEQPDGIESLCRTQDGGYLLAGYTFSQRTGDADILIIRTDPNGRLLWQRTYGGVGTEYGFDCIPFDGGFVVAGYTTSSGNGSKDICVLRLDQQGGEIWSRTFGGPSWDVGNAVVDCKDGTFLLTGFTHSGGAGEEDVILLKIDASGELVWSRTYGGERFELGNSVVRDDGGAIYIGATTGTYGNGNADMYLIKTDMEGNPLWQKSAGTLGQRGYGYDWCRSIAVCRDGIYLVGDTDEKDIQNAHIKKLDFDGKEIWQSTFGLSGFYDYGTSVWPTQDGGAIVSYTAKSIVNSPDIYDNDMVIVRFDAAGKKVWQQVLRSDGREWVSDMVVEDNGIVLAGFRKTGWSAGPDAVLIKVQIPN